MSLEDLVAQTKASVSALISKPKMAEKLLSRPPFRFLHDLLSAVVNTTGYGEGLMSGDELDSSAITDKQGKINYLEKWFTFVGICKGQALDVRAAKAVAGLEPENTNSFLIAFAACASDPNYDSAAAVRRTLDGEQAGSGPPALKAQGSTPDRAESKQDAGSEYAGSKGGGDNNDFGAKVEPPMSLGGMDAKSMEEERGKSRGGTRGGKPQQHSTDVGLGGMGGPSQMNLDGDVEKCNGDVSLTIEMLSAIITKPKLSEKLLGKPPFRFIFDIIMAVRAATGFANGLFSPDEEDGKAITDKQAKMMYLEKITKLVGIQLNTMVEARPAKIVAGLDAHLTNQFLQLLAVCGQKTPDSAASVGQVLDLLGVPGGEMPSSSSRDTGPSSREPEEPRQQSEEKSEPKSQEKPRETIGPASGAKGTQEAERKEIGGGGGDEDDGETKRSGRPTTARRRPPKVKEGAKEVEKTASPKKKVEGIMADGDDSDDDEIPDEIDNRLADEVHADIKPGTVAAGGPESKLVRDILGRQAEQEAARNPTEGAQAETKIVDDTDGRKGGIRFGRLRKTGQEKKNSSSGVTGPSGSGKSDIPLLGESDMERLRSSIQTLVQHTGPLGGCLDYLQEDIGLMSIELRKWGDECRKYEGRVELEKEKSEENLHPLKAELAELDEQINEMISRISSTKACVARNEDRIMQLFKLVASS